MSKTSVLLWSLLLAICQATSAGARTSGDRADAAAGRNIALQMCSNCHVVAPDQASAPILLQRTPTFEEIANRPKMSAKYLRHFINTTHWDEKTFPVTMPRVMLLDQQKTQVAHYILSLRKRP